VALTLEIFAMFCIDTDSFIPNHKGLGVITRVTDSLFSRVDYIQVPHIFYPIKPINPFDYGYGDDRSYEWDSAIFNHFDGLNQVVYTRSLQNVDHIFAGLDDWYNVYLGFLLGFVDEGHYFRQILTLRTSEFEIMRFVHDPAYLWKLFSAADTAYIYEESFDSPKTVAIRNSKKCFVEELNPYALPFDDIFERTHHPDFNGRFSQFLNVAKRFISFEKDKKYSLVLKLTFEPEWLPDSADYVNSVRLFSKVVETMENLLPNIGSEDRRISIKTLDYHSTGRVRSAFINDYELAVTQHGPPSSTELVAFIPKSYSFGERSTAHLTFAALKLFVELISESLRNYDACVVKKLFTDGFERVLMGDYVGIDIEALPEYILGISEDDIGLLVDAIADFVFVAVHSEFWFDIVVDYIGERIAFDDGFKLYLRHFFSAQLNIFTYREIAL